MVDTFKPLTEQSATVGYKMGPNEGHIDMSEEPQKNSEREDFVSDPEAMVPADEPEILPFDEDNNPDMAAAEGDKPAPAAVQAEAEVEAEAPAETAPAPAPVEGKVAQLEGALQQALQHIQYLVAQQQQGQQYAQQQQYAQAQAYYQSPEYRAQQLRAAQLDPEDPLHILAYDNQQAMTQMRQELAELRQWRDHLAYTGQQAQRAQTLQERVGSLAQTYGLSDEAAPAVHGLAYALMQAGFSEEQALQAAFAPHRPTAKAKPAPAPRAPQPRARTQMDNIVAMRGREVGRTAKQPKPSMAQMDQALMRAYSGRGQRR